MKSSKNEESLIYCQIHRPAEGSPNRPKMKNSSFRISMRNMGALRKIAPRRSLQRFPNWCIRNCVSSPVLPVFKVAPGGSVRSTHSPFAGYFSQSANLSLRVVCCARTRGVASGSCVAHESAQVRRFQELGFQVPQNKQFTVEPCLQRVESSHFVPNTPGGDGRTPVTRKKGLHVQRMSSRHAQRTPLPVARHARQALSVTSTAAPSAPPVRTRSALKCRTGSTAKALRPSSTEPFRPLPPDTSAPAAPLSSSTGSRCPPARCHRSRSWSPRAVPEFTHPLQGCGR